MILNRKKVDSLGRIVIPKILSKELKWNENDVILFQIAEDGQGLLLRKEAPSCLFAYEKEDLICIQNSVFLCKSCLSRYTDQL